MARKTKEELQEIMKKEKVDKIWSWSKFNCFHNSPYEYFLKYILHTPEDRTDCIYTTTGSITHDILEKFYSNEVSYAQMLEEFEDGWITAFDIAELKFDRNDESKNQRISDKYYFDLQHFFKNHKIIEEGLQLEQFAKVKVGKNLFQGYIDACYKNAAGNYVIVDWKTSSIYKGAKALNECGQLILYALALNQMGIPMDKIKICWNFVKYVSVEYEQANGNVKSREIERFEIGEKLQSNVKVWLKKFGHTSKIDDYIDLLLQTNSIDCLPEDVKNKYKISDCYVFVPITQELIDKWINGILMTIEDIEFREQEYEKTKNPKVFWDSEEHVKAQSFYFSTLCAYSPKLHLPYQEYLNNMESAQQEKNNIFSNVGVNNDEIQTADITSNSISENDIDMSWLDNI